MMKDFYKLYLEELELHIDELLEVNSQLEEMFGIMESSYPAL